MLRIMLVVLLGSAMLSATVLALSASPTFVASDGKSENFAGLHTLAFGQPASYYIYCGGTGGGSDLGAFANGTTTPAVDAAGFTAAEIANATSQSDSFQTNASFVTIAGAEVAGATVATRFDAVNSTPSSAVSASDKIDVAEDGTLVVLCVVGGGFQTMDVTAPEGMTTDTALSNNGGQVVPISIMHGTLARGSYFVNASAHQTVAGQAPTHVALLASVFAFSPNQPFASGSSERALDPVRVAWNHSAVLGVVRRTLLRLDNKHVGVPPCEIKVLPLKPEARARSTGWR